MALWTLEDGSSYEGALYHFSLLVQSYSRGLWPWHCIAMLIS